ncbi:hypothetical protein PM082_020862 [Marasmius tenuissimus]|nr:hypothetical protein PM082_020862 [Marasmius tenuissimus]
METGSLTAVVTSLHLILFVVMPNKNYHIAPDLVLAKLYSNSMMVVFNSRMHIHNSRGSHARSNDFLASGLNEAGSKVVLTTENNRLGCSGDAGGGQQIEVEEAASSWEGDCAMGSLVGTRDGNTLTASLLHSPIFLQKSSGECSSGGDVHTAITSTTSSA